MIFYLIGEEGHLSCLYIFLFFTSAVLIQVGGIHEEQLKGFCDQAWCHPFFVALAAIDILHVNTTEICNYSAER